jgi:hypothetical protein
MQKQTGPQRKLGDRREIPSLLIGLVVSLPRMPILITPAENSEATGLNAR